MILERLNRQGTKDAKIGRGRGVSEMNGTS